MSRVEFHEETITPRHSPKKQTEKGLIGLLIRYGLAKNTKQANSILLIAFAIMVVAIIFINVSRSSTPATDGPDPDDLIPSASLSN